MAIGYERLYDLLINERTRDFSSLRTETAQAAD
jgi:hypothetical protein